jgi:hypothetical protein
MRLRPRTIIGAAIAATLAGAAGPAHAQTPVDGEVRQLVTFRFLPGKSGEALAMYRERAVPLYEQNEAMLSFRGLREVESPVPLDIIIMSAFQGMAGMDASNAALRALAEASGSSIGAIYGSLGALSQSHDDQFVEMLPALGNGDATSKRLVALVWYEVTPGANAEFESALSDEVAAWEQSTGVPAATGRFLVSDGWSYLRFIGFDSLAAYQQHRAGLTLLGAGSRIANITTRKRDVILSSVPELAVR